MRILLILLALLLCKYSISQISSGGTPYSFNQTENFIAADGYETIVLPESKFSYGLTAGMGYNFTELTEASPLNFSLGLRTEIKLGDRIDLRTGVFAIQTGGKEASGNCYECVGCYCPTYTEYDFTFISVPINLKYTLSENKGRQYYVSLGLMPYFASRSVRRANFPEPTEGQRWVPEIGEININGYLFKRILNINCSPGMEFNITEKMMLQAELEVKYGLMEVTSSADDMFSVMINISLLHF